MPNPTVLMDKLRILTDAAKYDVACTSSGLDRKGQAAAAWAAQWHAAFATALPRMGAAYRSSRC